MQTANVEKKAVVVVADAVAVIVVIIVVFVEKGETLLCMLLGLISMFVLSTPSVSNM